MESRTYTKEDIIQMLKLMLKSIELEDTFKEQQVIDLTEFIHIFYTLGIDMGMSPFICRAALHELVEQACKE